tara:strand:+ start:717 stop:884 length:168 start_codon:yes stop_codon:yes gene_type:complete
MNNELMTKQELMEYLKISKSTIRNYINKGYLKPYGFDRKVWFKLSEVLENLERGD